MASRYFNVDGHLEMGYVELIAKVTYSSGTPTLVTASSQGFASCTDGGTGLLTLTLQDKYASFLGHTFSWVVASTGITAAPLLGVISEDVNSATAPAVNFIWLDADTPAATDPSDGTYYIHLKLKNSSI